MAFRKIIFSILCIVLYVCTKAQVAFTTEQSITNFSTISNIGTPLNLEPYFPAISGISDEDEGFANNVPIGFTFNYLNKSYSSLHVSTNGFISLTTAFVNGNTEPQDGFYLNNLFEGPSSINTNSNSIIYDGRKQMRGIIAPFWGDLNVNGGVYVKTIGQAPNRTCIIEWNQVSWGFNNQQPTLNIQLLIEETTNQIKFKYFYLNAAVSNQPKASIGLTSTECGFGSFLSFNPDYTFSKFKSEDWKTVPLNINTLTFKPIVNFKHNLAVASVSGHDVFSKTNEKLSVQCLIYNLGTQDETDIQVQLKVTGPQQYQQNIALSNLLKNNNSWVSFNAFGLQQNGQYKIQVSLVKGDDDLSDNLFEKIVTVTSQYNQVLGDTCLNSLSSLGNANNAEFATLFNTSSYKSINSISCYFPKANAATCKASIYEYNNGKPGVLLFKSDIVSTQSGWVSFPVNGKISVSGNYFVALEQVDTANVGLGFKKAYPQQTNSNFFRSPVTGNWNNLLIQNQPIDLAFKVQYENTLPVTQVQLSCEKIDNNLVQIKWITFSEVNSKLFTIQKSINGYDFQDIAPTSTKAPQGNSTSALVYSYTDQNSLNLNTYYRIKQTDLFGSNSFSEVVMLKGKGLNKIEINNFYPNPVESEIKLKCTVPKEDEYILIIHNYLGQLVLKQTLTLSQGINNIQTNISNRTKGIYTLCIVSKNNSELKSDKIKLVKN